MHSAQNKDVEVKKEEKEEKEERKKNEVMFYFDNEKIVLCLDIDQANTDDKFSKEPQEVLGGLPKDEKESKADLNNLSHSQAEVITYSKAARQILVFAVPFTIAQSIRASCDFVTLKMLANIDADHLAASSLISSSQTFLSTVTSSALFSLGILIPREVSAQNERKIGKLLQQGCLVGLVFSIPSIIIAEFMGDILIALDQPSVAAQIAQDFFRLGVFNLPLATLITVAQQASQGVSNPLPTLVSYVSMTSLTIGLSSALIPLYGAKGLGAAYSISSSATLIGLMAHLCWKKSRSFELFTTDFADRKAIFYEIIKEGVPVVLLLGSEVLGLFGITLLVGSFGQEYLSALQLVNPYILLAILPLLVMSHVTGIEVAKTSKAGKFVDAKRLGDMSILIGLGYAAVVATLFYSIPRTFSSVYIDVNDPANEDILSIAKPVFIISGTGLFLDSVRLVSGGALRGILDKRTSIGSSLFAVCSGGLLLGYIMAYPLGQDINGVFIARNIGLTLGGMAVACRWYFRSSHAVTHNNCEAGANIGFGKMLSNYSGQFFSKLRPCFGKRVIQNGIYSSQNYFKMFCNKSKPTTPAQQAPSLTKGIQLVE